MLDTAGKSIELCSGGKRNVHHMACTSKERISLQQRTVGLCACGCVRFSNCVNVCLVQYVVCAPMCARVKMLTECEDAVMEIMHSP